MFEGKKLAILGFGQEGQAIARFLKSKNLKFFIFEEKELGNWDKNQAGSKLDAENIFNGTEYLNNLANFDIIFRSPGFWRLHPAIKDAEQQGSVISSQTKLFFEMCPAKIIGITGTKGKGTTSMLIYNILNRAFDGSGQKVWLAGNIGKKTQPLDYINRVGAQDWVVYELSSFQLHDLTVSPHIGVCLMVTADHLDVHKDIEEYHRAKDAICKFQSPNNFCVYNEDFTATKEIALQGEGVKLSFGSGQNSSFYSAKIIEDSNKIIFNLNSGGFELDCTKRRLRGAHNLQNIAAAALATLTAGVDLSIIQSEAIDFEGLEHRLEFCGTKQGITFINDSISTAPETAVAGVTSFSQPVILLAGGSEKNLDYMQMGVKLSEVKNLKAVICYAPTGGKIAESLKRAGFEGKLTELSGAGFKDVFNEALKIAVNGDVILLSPASASFGMFKNYSDRGNQFKQLVSELS